MNNELNPLEKLTEAIERLCLENEILGLMLQDLWNRNRSWRSFLTEEANQPTIRNLVHASFAKPASASLADVPPSCLAIFESLTTAIAQTRGQSFDRVEKSKKAVDN